MEDEGFDFGADYRLGAPIGTGASGVVREGVRKSTGEAVAVKLLRGEYRDDPEVVRRFITERTALTSLRHPHVVAVADLIADGGRLGIVMEYAPGPTLRDLVRRRGTLPAQFALAVALQVLDALEAAHARGIVHRDIKPDNIILTSADDPADPGVRVADFGIARVLGEGGSSTRVVGTPAYMAPEAITRNVVSPEGDVYSLGTTLYEALSGRTPFDDGSGNLNPFVLAHRQVSRAVPPIAGLDPRVAEIVEGMLLKDPRKRPGVGQCRASISAVFPQVAGAAALPAPADPLPRPATVLGPLDGADPDAGDAPDDEEQGPPPEDPAPLPPPEGATVLKPIIVDDGAPDPDEGPRERWWRRRAARVGALACVAALACAASGYAVWHYGRSWFSPRDEAPVEATVEDKPLPSGLRVTRTASWKRSEASVSYTITYATVKGTLSGAVMENLSEADDRCLSPQWGPGAQAAPHSPALTSLKAACAWTITLPPLTAEGPVSVTATIPTAGTAFEEKDPDAESLKRWIDDQRARADAALSDPSASSSAYPLQRLEGLSLRVPGRTPQGGPVPLTITGKWRGGSLPDFVVYTSPSTGPATSVLGDITGGDPGSLRLSERCAGAVVVSADGHDLSAVFPASCSVGGQVGNYALEETPLTVTSSGS